MAILFSPQPLINDFQEHIQHAISSSPTGLADKIDGSDANVFALQSNAYYNLDAYLRVGLSLPSTISSFRGTYPEDRLAPLTDLDPTIYRELEVCLVGIHEHCDQFNSQCFSQFITVSHAVIAFCDFFARRVEGTGGLRDQIKILADEKVDRSDRRLPQALKISRELAAQISDEASKVETLCGHLLERLQTFLLQTKADEVHVNELHNKLIGGACGGPAYNDILFGKAADLQRSIVHMMREYKKGQGRNLEKQCTTAHFVLNEIAGLIVTSAVAAISTFLSRLSRSVQKYEKQMSRVQAKAQHMMTAFHCVMRLSSAICSIQETIGVAIQSLRSFTVTFGRIAHDFENIAARIGELHENVQLRDAFLRDMATINLEDASSEWAEIKELATAFVTFKPSETTDPYVVKSQWKPRFHI